MLRSLFMGLVTMFHIGKGSMPPGSPAQEPQTQPVVHNGRQHFEAIPHADFPWTRVLLIICIVGMGLLLAVALGVKYLENKKAQVTNGPVTQLQAQPTVTFVPTSIPTLTAQVDKDFWRTDISSFSAQELQLLQQTLLKNGEPQGGKLVVINIEKVGRYGELSTAIIDKSTNKPLGTEPGFAALYKDANNSWNLLLSSNPNFCSRIKTFPSIIADSARTFFCNN
ncbi:MAG: hypothetical protein KGJ07_03470 [Patescibacteria group bacterium]|nr:hypothetical protein [Patescibacteria group bacterium]MDE2588509.1 hypothetical protein [Patescibacteria group bacterium]